MDFQPLPFTQSLLSHKYHKVTFVVFENATSKVPFRLLGFFFAFMIHLQCKPFTTTRKFEPGKQGKLIWISECLRFSEDSLDFSQYSTSEEVQWFYIDWRWVNFNWILKTLTDSNSYWSFVLRTRIKLRTIWVSFENTENLFAIGHSVSIIDCAIEIKSPCRYVQLAI